MSEREVRKAESEVRKSTAEFDRAMEHLEETIEDGSEKIQRPIRKFRDAQDRARRAAMQGKEQLSEYARVTRDQSKKIYEQAQSSMRPWAEKAREQPTLIGAIVGAIGGLIALAFFFRNERKEERTYRIDVIARRAPL